MCMALLQNTVRACGIGTRVRFCPLGEAENLLKTLLPCGRAAVFADEGAPLMRVRARLAAYRPVCCVVGKEPLSGLFSLPDEVRAVVALGRRSIFAARFFASLRGGFVLAVPLAAAAEGLFEAALPKGYAQAGYPLRAPDIVLADEALLSGLSGAAGYAALSALCAEDLALHALFAEGAEDQPVAQAVHSLAAPAQAGADGFELGRNDKVQLPHAVLHFVVSVAQAHPLALAGQLAAQVRHAPVIGHCGPPCFARENIPSDGVEVRKAPRGGGYAPTWHGRLSSRSFAAKPGC